MKIAPLVHELNRLAGLRAGKPASKITWKLVHTGQHYDYEMSKVFFEQFDIPEPDYFLNVGSGTHAVQTARIMMEFEKVCQAETPGLVVVVGDVNSTLACSITAKKLNIKVAHVEAGLRSSDMTMPEEINRIVTDSVSDYLFVSEKSGLVNLKKEGKSDGQVHFVGNIMIDTLHYCLEKLSGLPACKPASVPYAVVTLHRPSNVDDPDTLGGILQALAAISRDMPVYFPIHPRTEKNINAFGLSSVIKGQNFRTMPPQSYLDFLALWKDASLVLTDSGGLQEETTALGIPCFTIRENTERPITMEEGTNVLVGTTEKGILAAYAEFRAGNKKAGRIPELWDGKTAQRITSILLAS
jgi:UDP-N-acetylglucosamine 2-epimerase (non-hydrolysing)